MKRRLTGLRPRLLLVVLLAVLPALVAIFQVAMRERREAIVRVGEDAERLASIVVREHERSLVEAESLVASFTRTLVERKVADPPGCAALAAGVLRVRPGYTNLGTIDAEGTLTCGAVPVAPGFSVGESPCFQKAKGSGLPAVCGFHIGTVTGKPTLSVVAPAAVLGPLGGFGFASIDGSWFQRTAAGDLLPPGGALTVVDTGGVVVARHPDGWIGRRLPESPLLASIMSRTEKTELLAGADGLTRVYAVKSLRGEGPALGYLAVGISPDERLARAGRAMRNDVLVLAGVLALALAAAWLGGEVLVLRPMHPFVEATRRIGFGDLSARAGPPYAEGEVGELAHAFDEMAAALQEREAERKRADEERGRLAAILESTSDFVAMADASGRLLYLNAAARSVLGVGQEEDVSLLNVRELHPPLVRDLILSEAFAAARERGSWRGETAWRGRDGREIPTSQVVLAHRGGGVVELYSTVARDITDIKRAETALVRSYEALRALAGRLESVREEEGTRIAREIHDELGQALTAFKMDVAWIRRKCADPGTADTLASLLEPRLVGMLKLVDGTIDIVHRISTELRPGVLDDLGLAPAVEWQAGEFEKRFGIECSVTTAAVTPSRAVATAAFRILQEILTNAARHSGATEVSIALKEEAGELLLQVRDNGKGVDEAALSDAKSFGLVGMRERAALVGGTVRLTGEAGRGTVVAVRLPLRGEADWGVGDPDPDDAIDEAM